MNSTDSAVTTSLHDAPNSPSPNAPRTRLGSSEVSHSKSRSCVIIDVLNVIRLSGRERPRLEVLLHVLLEAAVPAADYLAIADANTWRELREKQGLLHAEIFAKMCKDYPYHFFTCTGGTQADPYVLGECAALNGCIISNDRYRDRQYRHPWVTTRDDRFVRLSLIRNALYINEERYVLGGAQTLYRQFVDAMARRETCAA